MKYLLQTNSSFWLDQIIRLGIYEKIEILSNNNNNFCKKIETNNINQQNSSILMDKNLIIDYKTIIDSSKTIKSEKKFV